MNIKLLRHSYFYYIYTDNLQLHENWATPAAEDHVVQSKAQAQLLNGY